MVTLTKLDSIAAAVRRYNLRVVSRKDDAGTRVYLLARAGSGTRGGHLRNVRQLCVLPSLDCELHRLGLLRRNGTTA